MRLNQNWWTFKKKTQEFLISNELKNNARFIKGAILAILSGFIIAGIIIAAQNVNPFEYYVNLFRTAFHPLYVNQTLQWLSVYVVAGLAMAVSFKTGLFNIGVSGQMLAGASMGTVVFNLVTPGATKVEGWLVFVIFLMCVAMGTLLAGIAGWLKAMFNIHEVVTTIMLNWFIWYLFKFIFFKWQSIFTPNGVATNLFPGGTLDIGASEIAAPILIAVVAVVIIWIVFSKTVFGFRLKAVGSSPSVSKYAGINVKNKIIATMAISGALAGLASFLNIFTVSPNISFAVDNLPTVGYDAIAVALVAFNNPFGIVGVSLLWGTVQSAGGSAAALFNMPSQMSLLIFGIVVYFAAISIVFIKWAPGYTLKLRYYIWNSKLYSNKTKELNKIVLQYRWWIHEPSRNQDYAQQMKNFKQRIKVAQSSKEIKEIKLEMKNYKFNFKENCHLNLNKYTTQLKNFKANVYLQEIERGIKGIKTRSSQRINQVNERGLDAINLLNLKLVKTQTELTKKTKEITQIKKNKLQLLKNCLVKDKNALKVWREGQIGNLRWDFEFDSQKIAFKGEYSKQKNIFEEEIKVAHTEKRLQFRLIKFNDQLSQTEKKNERQKIVVLTKAKIRKIKSEIVELKKDFQQNITQLKEKHNLRAQELQKNPAKIQAVEKEYTLRLAQINEKYQADLLAIDEFELTRVGKFDLPKAHEELNQGQQVLTQTLGQLATLKFNAKLAVDQQIQNLQKQLEIIRQALKKLDHLFGHQKFKETDDDQTVVEKTKILLQLAKLKHLLGVQLTIIETNQTLIKTKNQNQKVLTNYKKNLISFKQEYKKNLQVLKEQPKDKNYQKSVIENEQVYFNKINEYIDDLENKYIIKVVN